MGKKKGTSRAVVKAGLTPEDRKLLRNFQYSKEGHAPIVNTLAQAVLGFNPSPFFYTNFTGTQLNQTDSLYINNRWYLVSNKRQLLSESYVEHGVFQGAVDIPVDDAFRGGIEILSQQLSPDQIKQVTSRMDREGDLTRMAQAQKWKRLFGGSGLIINNGQPLNKPLTMRALRPDAPLEFIDCDMWELSNATMNLNSDYGLAMDGYPDDANNEYYTYYSWEAHYTRVMRMNGLRAPSFIRPRLRGWGLSIMEIMVNSINQYLKTNNLVFEVLDEFKIDVYKIKGLAASLLQKDGTAKVRRRVQLANLEKNYQNALTLDKEDDYQQKELSFTGIAETMEGIRLQLASDLRMPMAKLFGEAAKGFSSGEDTIENYNAMVESTVRTNCKYDLLRMVEIRCAQLFGKVPTDLDIGFKPLRVLGAEAAEKVKDAKYKRIESAVTKGLMTVREYKDAVNKENLLVVAIDPNIDRIEMAQQDEDVAEEGESQKPVGKSVQENVLTVGATPRIAVVAIVSDGKVLTGKRTDNGKWTFPGGHIDLNETPEEGAIREVMEESGIALTLSELTPLPAKRLISDRVQGKVFIIHPFVARLPQIIYPKTTEDPDGEIEKWDWVPIGKTTPELDPERRHAGQRDILVEYLLKTEVKK